MVAMPVLPQREGWMKWGRPSNDSNAPKIGQNECTLGELWFLCNWFRRIEGNCHRR